MEDHFYLNEQLTKSVRLGYLTDFSKINKVRLPLRGKVPIFVSMIKFKLLRENRILENFYTPL